MSYENPNESNPEKEKKLIEINLELDEIERENLEDAIKTCSGDKTPENLSEILVAVGNVSRSLRNEYIPDLLEAVMTDEDDVRGERSKAFGMYSDRHLEKIVPVIEEFIL